MPSPASPKSRRNSRFATFTPWCLLAVALLLLIVATRRRIDRVNALTNSPTWSVDAPARDGTSATGFAHGQRSLIVPGLHTPSFWWIMEAQQAASEHRWRLRHVDYDAPPKGRDTFRTAPYRWWLTIVGWVRGAIHGETLGYAIERGALVADPLLLALMLIVGTGYIARYFGPLAAAGYVVAGASFYPLTASFQPGAPDPHSLAWVLALGSLLPLLVPSMPGRRKSPHFVFAGFVGGLGLWNDAHTQMPVLLAIAIGAMVSELVRLRSEAANAPTANWRAWALTGALTVLAASLFEFAPRHFSWALEAVNPLHAVVWWGFGELVHAAALWRRDGRAGFDRSSLVFLGTGVIAAAAWPLVGYLTKSGSLLASDFYALELANDAHASTAGSLAAWLHQSGNPAAQWATLLPIVLAALGLAWLFVGKTRGEQRGRLVLLLVLALVTIVLGCRQLRWWSLFDIVGLGLVATLLAGAEMHDGRRHWAWLSSLLVVLPGLFVAFPPAINGQQLDDIAPSDAQGLVARDFSYWLARRAGAEHDVVLSTPIFSTAMAYYGGFGVIASSDDENKDSVLAAARMATANTLDEASILLRTRGVTRVVLPLWDPMVSNLVRTGRYLPADAPLPDDAFWVGLLRWGSPVWMQAMNYVIPPSTGLEDFQVVSYALRPAMENDVFLSRLADFFVERGLTSEAQQVRQALKDYPRSIVALGAIARVDLALKDQSHLDETIETLIPYLSRASARHLPADRRVSLASVLIRTRHPDLARDQIATCLKTLDAEMLRTLTPGAVRDLLTLMRDFNLTFSDPALKPAALGLLPPGVRVRLAQ